MLLCSIIDELHNTLPSVLLPSDRSAAVLRGLLHMLVSQQPCLVSHIRNRYDESGKALFKNANDWAPVTEIFANVLQDPQLKITYLVIDALIHT